MAVALALLMLGAFGFVGFGGPARAQVSDQTSRQMMAQATPAPSAPKSFLPSRAGNAAPSAPQAPNGFFDRVYAWVMIKQREINSGLAGAVRSLKDGGGWHAAMLLAALGFIYGVVHAAGPGHGKAVISSYVLADGETMRRGMLLAFMAAFVQALVALAVVGILVLALKSSQADIRATEAWLESASWAFIGVFGMWLLWRQVRPMLASRPALAGHPGGHAHGDHSHRHHEHAHHDHAQHDHAHHGHAHHGHDHAHHAHGHTHHAQDHTHAAGDVCDACGHAHMPNPEALKTDWSWRRALTLAFAIGIRPCTGAILVLVFAISQGLMWAGVMATFAMAIGTAITVSALAALAVGSRDLATRLAGRGGGSVWVGRMQQAIGVLGAAAVMLIGVSFFFYSLSNPSPF